MRTTTVITSVSGHIGQYLAEYALQRGHHVRGLSRSKDKMPTRLLDHPNFDFIKLENYFDEVALYHACQGADAVICATAIKPELQLSG
jgi:nucleoside-diphosphate-sugar epimerase